jgi:CRP-like cAMP-binding protein
LNSLLTGADAGDLGWIQRACVLRTVPAGTILYSAGQKPPSALFPTRGVLSLNLGDKGSIGAALVGSEGFAGPPLLSPGSPSPYTCFALVESEVLCVLVRELLDQARSSPAFWVRLLRYTHLQHLQTATLLKAAASEPLNARAAGFIAMVSDRCGGELRLTHDMIAAFLHVRRAGVTGAIHSLEGQGVLRARRGLLAVRNREQLVRIAAGAYGLSEREYERVFAVRPAAAATSEPPRPQHAPELAI